MTREERDKLYYDRRGHNKKCKLPDRCNCCGYEWIEEACRQDIDEGIKPPFIPED